MANGASGVRGSVISAAATRRNASWPEGVMASATAEIAGTPPAVGAAGAAAIREADNAAERATFQNMVSVVTPAPPGPGMVSVVIPVPSDPGMVSVVIPAPPGPGMVSVVSRYHARQQRPLGL